MKTDFISALDFVKKNEMILSRDVGTFLSKGGGSEELFFDFQDPIEISQVSTLSMNLSRPISEMLRKRFHFASRIVVFVYHFFSADEMMRVHDNEFLMATHHAYKENWEGSAPNIYPEDCLSLFGSTYGLYDNIFYLVWKNEDVEPEVWSYFGQEERKYLNIDHFIKGIVGGLMEECGIDWVNGVQGS